MELLLEVQNHKMSVQTSDQHEEVLILYNRVGMICYTEESTSGLFEEYF